MKLLIILFTIVLFSSFIHTDRNIVKVYANSNDELIFEQEHFQLSNLTDTLKIILANKSDNHSFPENRYRNIPYFGKTNISRAIVSIACERGTSYEFYIKVQNEVERAYNELRNELSIKEFKKEYKLLDDKKKKAINSYYPKRISEAEPRNLN